MPNEREEFEAQYAEGRFVDFVDEHTTPISDRSDRSLMGEGFYHVDPTGQLLPFDRAEFAQFRGADPDDDPGIVERSEVTLFIGDFEIMTVSFNLLTDRYTIDLNGNSKKELSEEYKHLPAALIKILKEQDDEGRLSEASDEEIES